MMIPCLSLLGTTRGTPDSVPVSSGGDRVRGGGGGRGRCCRQWLSGALPLKQGNDEDDQRATDEDLTTATNEVDMSCE